MQVHYKSERQDWGTPWGFFLELNSLYNFKLDACASIENAKVYPFIDEEKDSLKCDWGAGPIWVNPPYGRFQINFIKKALDEHKKNGATIVMLIPARPDTAVWQDVILPNASAVCFIRGRLKFEGAEFSAPFPCALVIFGRISEGLHKFGHVIKKD